MVSHFKDKWSKPMESKPFKDWSFNQNLKKLNQNRLKLNTGQVVTHQGGKVKETHSDLYIYHHPW